MRQRDDLLRFDTTGTGHALGRDASVELRTRTGDWRLLPGTNDAMLLARVGSTRTIRICGEIRTPGGLCDVLALVVQSAWKCEVVALAEEGSRTLYFDAGTVVGASTTVPTERLGDILLRAGALAESAVKRIGETCEATGRRFGEIAVEQGHLAREELFPMMARQVEEIFYNSSKIDLGSFYVFEGFAEARLGMRHSLSGGMLLMEGARRMDELRFFREKIPSESCVPQPIKEGAPPEELAKVFGLCDGRRSIREIGRLTGLLEFEATSSVFQLIGCGFVALAPTRVEGPKAIVELCNAPLSAIHDACDHQGLGGVLRDGLARFATGGGVYDPLFLGAGPATDGSLRGERVQRNLAAIAGEDSDTFLATLMNDYVQFALFQAEAMLPRETHETLRVLTEETLKPLRPLLVASPNQTKGKP